LQLDHFLASKTQNFQLEKIAGNSVFFGGDRAVNFHVFDHDKVENVLRPDMESSHRDLSESGLKKCFL
jgi:hypothetical protein